MKNFLFFYFLIIFTISCAKTDSSSSVVEKKEGKISIPELILHLLNFQAFALPVVSRNISSDGKTILVEKLDHKHRAVREDLYFEGKIVSRIRLKYDDWNNIVESLHYNDQGELILHQQFLYRPDNSLLQIFQKNQTVLYERNRVYSDKGAETLIIDYFKQGTLTSSDVYHAGLLAKEKNYFYDEGYLVKEITQDPSEETERISYYDRNQNLTAVTFLKSNQFIQHEEYFYEDKLLVKKTVEEQDGVISEYVYIYGENDVLTKMNLYQDNTLQQSTIYLPEGRYIIEYYAFGRVRMTELYENNILLKQEIVDDSFDLFPEISD